MAGLRWFQTGDYRPSGKCDWFKLLTVALPLSLLATCLPACGLFATFHIGFYLLFIMPMFAGLLVGAQVAFLFRYAHCRNLAVAGVIGFALGTLTYLEYYECRFVSADGPQALARVDLLPRYINYCLHTDVVRSTHDLGNRKKEPDFYENVIFFVMDWLGAACACGVLAFLAARRAYCETCARWMMKKKASAASGAANAVAGAVSAKQIGSLPAMAPSTAKRGAAAAQFELEYCPGGENQADVCPIFLSATETTPGNKRNVVVARQVRLTVEELAELSRKLSFK